MLLAADEVGRSLRGAAALVGRRPDALKTFDFSERGFWRSFGAIWLTLPAATVALALVKSGRDGPLLAFDAPTLAVAAANLGCFLAVPVAAVPLLRRAGLSARYVPFVVATNWLLAAGLTLAALPALLMLGGFATPGLARLDLAAVAVLATWTHARAARATLGVTSAVAAFVALGSVVLVATVGVGCVAWL